MEIQTTHSALATHAFSKGNGMNTKGIRDETVGRLIKQEYRCCAIYDAVVLFY